MLTQTGTACEQAFGELNAAYTSVSETRSALAEAAEAAPLADILKLGKQMMTAQGRFRRKTIYVLPRFPRLVAILRTKTESPYSRLIVSEYSQDPRPLHKRDGERIDMRRHAIVGIERVL